MRDPAHSRNRGSSYQPNPRLKFLCGMLYARSKSGGIGSISDCLSCTSAPNFQEFLIFLLRIGSMTNNIKASSFKSCSSPRELLFIQYYRKWKQIASIVCSFPCSKYEKRGWCNITCSVSTAALLKLRHLYSQMLPWISLQLWLHYLAVLQWWLWRKCSLFWPCRNMIHISRS